MEPMLLRIFQKHALEQCTYILIADNQLAHYISTGSYNDEFWREVQNFVISTANVSKLLWGQGRRFAKERKPLRDSIKVGDSSPLRPPTRMRNHFEHMDERLDKWWAESGSRNYVGRTVGPPGMIVGPKDMELFQGYDPATGIVRFWGNTYNLKEVVEEVRRIYPLLQTEAAKPHWEA